MNIEENKRIGRLLAELRTQSGKRQSDVSAALKKPQSYISKIETGERSLQLNELAPYAAALGRSVAEVLEYLHIE